MADERRSYRNETWTDDRGVVWPVPRPGPLSYSERAAHAALRRFVFVRDAFTCQWCGAMPTRRPGDEWDGRNVSMMSNVIGYRAVFGMYRDCEEALWRSFQVDHVIPRARGGTNHPRNLRVLCSTCNRSKCDRAEPLTERLVNA